jgi:hypothetical protein
MLSLDGGMKVSEGSTIVLCIDGDIRVLEQQHQKFTDSVWMDSAPGTLEFNNVTLFLFALMHPFCCTAHG